MHDPYETISMRIEDVQHALSDANRYYCSQKLGREPTLRELLTHFIDNTIPYRVTAFDVSDDGNPLFV